MLFNTSNTDLFIHLFIFTSHFLIMPGLVTSYLQITIVTIRAVGPTVNVVGCHYGMDHLSESSRSMDFGPTLASLAE